MFVQVITGKTSHPEALREATDRWFTECAPGAIGWLGTTGGITDEGRVVVVARFESPEAAAANGSRPEQDKWWSETSSMFDGEVTFDDSTDVMVNASGDLDQAGFVQVMRGRSSDPVKARELMDQDSTDWEKLRPDILGTVEIGHDDGRWTMVIYCTSEADAREGEKKEMPPEMQQLMAEMEKLTIGEPEYIDLKQPILSSPS